MAANRQQRSRQNRRAPNGSNAARPEDIPCIEARADTHHVTMFLNQQVEGLIITGIPRLYCLENEEFADSMTTNTNQLVFHFATVLGDAMTYMLQTADPAVRTPWGGYLAALEVQLDLT